MSWINATTAARPNATPWNRTHRYRIMAVQLTTRAMMARFAWSAATAPPILFEEAKIGWVARSVCRVVKSASARCGAASLEIQCICSSAVAPAGLDTSQENVRGSSFAASIAERIHSSTAACCTALRNASPTACRRQTARPTRPTAPRAQGWGLRGGPPRRGILGGRFGRRLDGRRRDELFGGLLLGSPFREPWHGRLFRPCGALARANSTLWCGRPACKA